MNRDDNSARAARGSIPVVALIRKFLALLALLAGACGDGNSVELPGIDPSPGEEATPNSGHLSGEPNPVGILTALFDGNRRTWYAVSVEVDGELTATATWSILDEITGEGIAFLGGLDQSEIPPGFFGAGLDDSCQTCGEYRGTTLTVGFPFRAADRKLSLDAADASIVYLPEAVTTDASGMYGFEEGVVVLERIELVAGGTGRFVGTFRGTLTSMDGNHEIEVSDGRFEIDGARYFHALKD